ncbi:hypothetical protein [Bradyrhizobium sp.]|uniref:hypothetical protein n=1 Tax=Bradyrhizobium sp. TaxID=376 RepID=UPI001ECF10FB|nr:hypothetical protein [Bradyrhizobium sp.]MBV9982809.1 hypothetical protein [Bradyrhizobium sp.]
MKLRIAAVAFAALGGVALTSTATSAMPNGIPNANAIAGQTSNLEQARWVRDSRGRLVWRTRPRVHVVVGPRRFWGPRRFAAVGPGPVWGPGWGSSVAWGAGPAWGPRPVWGGAYAMSPGPVWGPRPGWGWNGGWW